jgi:hypothetical protein
MSSYKINESSEEFQFLIFILTEYLDEDVVNILKYLKKYELVLQNLILQT